MPNADHNIRSMAVVVGLAISLAGCVNGRPWQPFAAPAPPALAADATTAEVVAHVNSNIQRCMGWRSHGVEVKSNGFPLGAASAKVAVESPRNFRMKVSTMGVDLADLGSNTRRIWFWVKPGRSAPPRSRCVHTCSYSELSAARSKFAIPFHPQWLMEVMGVMPIDPNSVTMRTASTNPSSGEAALFLLESPLPPQNGVQWSRRVTVSAQSGNIVSHALVNAATGQVVAEARMSDHRPDPETGIVLPHRIELRYPRANVELTLTFDEFTVNPGHFAASIWQPTVSDAVPMRNIVSGQIVTPGQVATASELVPGNLPVD